MYDVIVYVIYDFSLRTVVHYMVMISFSNMTPHQLSSLGKTDSSLAVS